jgi:hypothetical protein
MRFPPCWLVVGLAVGMALGVVGTPVAGAQVPAPTAQPPAPMPAEGTAQAEPQAATGSPQDSARDHFKRGEAAYEKGNYTLAVSEWQAAYASDPRPRIQYNVYQALERLGQLPEAADALQRYLSTADPDDPYYSDATARMSALQQRLQSTGVLLTGGVEGASVNVSGHDWGLLPRPDRIPVQPGNHRVVITLAGYKDFVANVIVPAGQVVDVAVQLEPLAKGAAATGTKPTTDAARARQSPMPFFVASAILGGGTVLSAIWTINRAGALSGCNDPAYFCPNKNAVATQRTIAIGLTATLGVGAIATLIYGLVLNGRSDEHAALCVPSPTGATCRVQF